jgi:hypothetical protein
VLSAIAFCPSPPLLVPELAAGAAAELDPLRAACRHAVRRLLATGPDEIIVIATALGTRQFPAGTTGTLAGYGVPVTAVLPGGRPGRYADSGSVPDRYGEPLPLGLTLGAWLLTGAEVPCSAFAVGPETDPAELAAGLDRSDRRRGLLVMGDGSARRSEQAPGYVDPRAAAFDAGVADALATGDAAALRSLDPALGAELLASGVPAWRVAAHAATALAAPTAAVAGTAAAPTAGGAPAAEAAPYGAELLHDSAPYGVAYFVAIWTAR